MLPGYGGAHEALLQRSSHGSTSGRSTSSTMSRVRRPPSTLVAVLSVGCGHQVADLIGGMGEIWLSYGYVKSGAL